MKDKIRTQFKTSWGILSKTQAPSQKGETKAKQGSPQQAEILTSSLQISESVSC